MSDRDRGAGRSFAERFPTFAGWSANPRVRAAARGVAQTARAIARVVVPIVTWGPVLGALYMIGVTYVAVSGPMIADDEHVLGAPGGVSPQLASMVLVRYADDLARMITQLVAIAAALGALLGAIAAGLVGLAVRLQARRPSRAERAVWTLAIVAVIQGGTFAWSMARDPQLYERSWNAAGGMRRACQTLVSARLGPSPVIAIAIAIVMMCVLVPIAVRRARSHLAPRDAIPPREIAAITSGLLALAMLVAAFTLVPPRASMAPHVTSDRPNVILLAADSLRDDRLTPQITPHLADLAAKGTRFTRAYVSLPRTLPSWTTMLTGQWSHHHGLRTMFPSQAEKARARDTIVAHFRDAGYATAAVSDFAGDFFPQLDLGFESLLAPKTTRTEYFRMQVLKRAKPLLPFLHSRLGRWLVPTMREIPLCANAGFLADDVIDTVRRDTDRPFFLVGFFGAPHLPYATPSPYFERFTDATYEGELKYDRLVWDPFWHPSDAEVHQLRGLYDGAVASFDDAVARVLAELDRAQIADRTIVVILADHGESLFDGDRTYAHGSVLAGDETTHIPLIVRDPRHAGGKTVTDLVRDVDLAPTLCELAGISCPSAMDGTSFAKTLDGVAIAPRLTYGETGVWFTPGTPALRIPYPDLLGTADTDARNDDALVLRPAYETLVDFAKHRMVFDGRWKLVYMPTPDAPRYFLFDTSTDPLEVHDVSADHPAELARLHDALWAWMLQDSAMEDRHGWLAPRGVHIAYVDGDGLR